METVMFNAPFPVLCAVLINHWRKLHARSKMGDNEPFLVIYLKSFDKGQHDQALGNPHRFISPKGNSSLVERRGPQLSVIY